MSSRPVTNLERILASVNFKEDEVVLTPEPLMINGPRPFFNFDQIPTPNAEETDSDDEKKKKEKEEEEFFTASQGTSYSSSSEDVPLTAELLSPGIQVATATGTRNIWNGSQRASGKRLMRRSQRSSSSCLPIKNNGLSIDRPATLDTVFHYDSTSDGLDVYQERERNKKRKMKKRSNGNDEKREKEKGKKN